MKEWLELEEGVRIPDDDELQTDLIGPRKKDSHNNDFSLESKDSMRKRKVRSPDLGDALALTFADLSQIKRWTEKSSNGTYGQDVDRTVAPKTGPQVVDIDANGNVYGENLGDNGWMA